MLLEAIQSITTESSRCFGRQPTMSYSEKMLLYKRIQFLQWRKIGSTDSPIAYMRSQFGDRIEHFFVPNLKSSVSKKEIQPLLDKLTSAFCCNLWILPRPLSFVHTSIHSQEHFTYYLFICLLNGPFSCIFLGICLSWPFGILCHWCLSLRL